MKVPNHFSVRVGGNVFADKPNVLVYKDTPLLQLRRDESGFLDVDLDVFSREGNRKATIRSSTLIENDGTVALFVSDQCIRVVDQIAERTVCDICRRAAANDADIDISLLLHAPDGFLIHANTAQSNLPARSASTGFGKR